MPSTVETRERRIEKTKAYAWCGSAAVAAFLSSAFLVALVGGVLLFARLSPSALLLRAGAGASTFVALGFVVDQLYQAMGKSSILWVLRRRDFGWEILQMLFPTQYEKLHGLRPHRVRAPNDRPYELGPEKDWRLTDTKVMVLKIASACRRNYEIYFQSHVDVVEELLKALPDRALYVLFRENLDEYDEIGRLRIAAAIGSALGILYGWKRVISYNNMHHLAMPVTGVSAVAGVIVVANLGFIHATRTNRKALLLRTRNRVGDGLRDALDKNPEILGSMTAPAAAVTIGETQNRSLSSSIAGAAGTAATATETVQAKVTYTSGRPRRGDRSTDG
jgi:uncharacterized membrane protein YraQ (UPF0718 family)